MQLFWCMFQPFARFVAVGGIAGLFFMQHHLWTEPANFLVNPWNIIICIFAWTTACTYVTKGECSEVWILVSITGTITMLNSGNIAETRAMLLIFMPVIYTTMMLQMYCRLYPTNKEVGVSVLLFCNLMWHVSLDFVDVYFFLRTISDMALCSDDAIENKMNDRPFFFFLFVTTAELRECTDAILANPLRVATHFPVMFFAMSSTFFHQQSFPAIYEHPISQFSGKGDRAPQDANSPENKVMKSISATVRGIMRMATRLLYGPEKGWNADDDYRTVSSLIIARKRNAVISLLFVDMPFIFMRVFMIKSHVNEACTDSCVISSFLPLFFPACDHAQRTVDSHDDGLTVFLYKNLVCLGLQSIWLRICQVLENDLLSAMKKREVARMTGSDVDSDRHSAPRAESRTKLEEDIFRSRMMESMEKLPKVPTFEDEVRRRGKFAEVLRWSRDVDGGMLNTLQRSSRSLRAYDDLKSVLSRESRCDSVVSSQRLSGGSSSVGSWSSNSSHPLLSLDSGLSSTPAVVPMRNRLHGILHSRSLLPQFYSNSRGKHTRRSSSPASPNLADFSDTCSMSPHPRTSQNARAGAILNAAKQHQSPHRRINAPMSCRGVAGYDARSKVLSPSNVATPARSVGLGSSCEIPPPIDAGERIPRAASCTGTPYSVAHLSPWARATSGLQRRSSFPANLATSVEKVTTMNTSKEWKHAFDRARSMAHCPRSPSKLSYQSPSRREPRQVKVNRRHVADKNKKEDSRKQSWLVFLRKSIRLPHFGASARKRSHCKAVDVTCTRSQRRTRVYVWRTTAFTVGLCMANVLARQDFLTSFPVYPPSEFTPSELQSILGIFYVPE